MTSPKNTSPVPDGLSLQPCRFGTLSSSTSAEHVMKRCKIAGQTTKHLLNPWGILPKKGGGFRLSEIVLGDSKKHFSKFRSFSMLQNSCGKQCHVSPFQLLQPAFVGQAPHLWENPQSESEQNSGLVSCLVVCYMTTRHNHNNRNKHTHNTQQSQPQQWHILQIHVWSLIIDPSLFSSLRYPREHGTSMLFFKAQVLKPRSVRLVSKLTNKKSRSTYAMHHVMAQNCGTPKGTTDLGIKFWANKVLALNWEGGAFSRPPAVEFACQWSAHLGPATEGLVCGSSSY